TQLGGFTWIVHVLQVFAFAPLPLAFLGYLALCAAQGFLFGVFALVLRWASLRRGWRMAALLPIALVAVEFAYPLLFQSYTDVAQRAAPQLRIGIAQPNVGEIELHSNPFLSVRTLWGQTAELHGRSADLVVWPEVGFNLRPIKLGEDGRSIQGGIPVALIAGV